ncbi:UbiA family prenyltransferase [Alloyangia pacifica]|uniref:4-hydroxybenzoate polyprenyltransferase n=1 Tax=Alloyangia pacifica TaxID=311180 RepID=A0A1I6WED2_9RHOB|nr:UbiA family prenyltransferase [Alloyangia pacifica]SDI62599.1 4-hydroxybenzoate polyprenyltransferase [Alloyangia pacifica]SFT24353.1 4-hydroxybenzoate polyprenyltransferase [Alloyangia pacifica]
MDDSHNFRIAQDDLTLVIDLDGTLIRSDMLYETFWSAISRRWLNLVPALHAVCQGRAALKRRLEELGAVEPGFLPYNTEVIAHIKDWRAQGGRTALVSASDQRIVDRISAHLGLFDDVHGSDGKHNLKGEAKAERLLELYGRGNFVYVGDSSADVPVWNAAERAVTVDVSPALAKRVDQQAGEVKHLQTGGADRTHAAFRALRPHQWLKNVLVFLPLLAAHKFEWLPITQALLAFVAYSLIASSVYLLNDLLDLAADRAHPRKRTRPFAAGDLPLSWGTVMTPALLLAGFALAAFLGTGFFAVMAFYFVMTTAYSLALKRKLVVDICTLAGLYTLRIIAGGVATQTPLSVWLLAFSVFFFFSLAAVKRQAELVSSAAQGNIKAQGRGYTTEDIPVVANMAVASGYISILVMALYLNTDAVRRLYNETAPLWGICLVLLFWVSRTVMITHRGWMQDDPVIFAAKDRVSLVCAVSIFVLATAGVML